MVGSFFRPTAPAHNQNKPLGQVRVQNNGLPSYGIPLPPSPLNRNKSGFVTSTRLVPSPLAKPNSQRRPSLTRTQSSPSMTTAPMFPDEILENLYISDLETARAVLSPNYASPGRPKVKYVLTILDNSKDQPTFVTPATSVEEGNPEFVRKLIKLSDMVDVNILEKLPEACAFIRQSLANNDGGVLVHCRKGISRSGSVIVAYLMQELGLGFDDALTQAKKARNKIWPNRAFGEQLRMWKDLDYVLVDETGIDKAPYAEWKSKNRFRPEEFDI